MCKKSILSVKKKKKALRYNCADCPFQSEKETDLNAHMLKQTDDKLCFECGDCGKGFGRKAQLAMHSKTHHSIKKVDIKQYNCEDCPFQGENTRELKMHVKRTKHCAGGSIEVCYTCKKEFESYWHLMNHRREEHPSNRVCRYFKLGSCDFDDGECWYKHTTKSMPQKSR